MSALSRFLLGEYSIFSFFDEFTSIRFDNVGGLARPVNLNNVSRLVFEVHGGLGFVNVVCVVLVELGGFVGQFADRPALFTVLQP